MKPKTIEELKKYVELNCFNINHYSISNNFISEGFGIELIGSLYVWYYVERGNKENIEYFESEEKIVDYAFEIILNDKYAMSNLLVNLHDENKLKELTTQLENNKINFWVEEIKQIGLYNKLFRLFIVGCDIKRVTYKDEKLIFDI